MRYSKEHKQETHARIVKKASVRLREKGAHGIGVADLMKDAGLTHGGFYAHFDSREALVIEAFGYAMDRSIAHWRKKAEQTPSDKRLAAIVDSYLEGTLVETLRQRAAAEMKHLRGLRAEEAAVLVLLERRLSKRSMGAGPKRPTTQKPGRAAS